MCLRQTYSAAHHTDRWCAARDLNLFELQRSEKCHPVRIRRPERPVRSFEPGTSSTRPDLNGGPIIAISPVRPAKASMRHPAKANPPSPLRSSTKLVLARRQYRDVEGRTRRDRPIPESESRRRQRRAQYRPRPNHPPVWPSPAGSFDARRHCYRLRLNATVGENRTGFPSSRPR